MNTSDAAGGSMDRNAGSAGARNPTAAEPSPDLALTTTETYGAENRTAASPVAGGAPPAMTDHPRSAAGGAVSESVGRYRLVRRVGGGAFGEVFEAFDPELDRRVALKLPRGGPAAAVADLDRFRSEGRILARLRHPGLVAVFDAGVTPDGRPFVVSELVEGRDLADRLACEGKLTPAEAARVVAEAAEALAAAHAAGVVHRDVKPANLMLDREGRVRVADFGLALPDDRQESARGEVGGSPAYMAPEQFAGKAHLLDGRADVWGLGVVFYELLTGRRPFTSRTVRTLAEEVRERDVRPVRMLDARLPTWCDRVIGRCLAKRPGDRYQTALDLAADLRAEAAGNARTGPTTSGIAAAVVSRRHRRRLTAATAAAIAALAAVAELGDVFVSHWRHETPGRPVVVAGTSSAGDSAAAAASAAAIPDAGPPPTAGSAGPTEPGSAGPVPPSEPEPGGRRPTDAAAGGDVPDSETPEEPELEPMPMPDPEADSGEAVVAAAPPQGSAGTPGEPREASKPREAAEPLGTPEPLGAADGTSGALAVLITSTTEAERAARSVTDAGVLPVETGDEVTVVVSLSRPAYLYVVWIGSDQGAAPLYPWRDLDWGRRPDTEEPRRDLSIPAGTISPTPAVETVLVLACESPLPPEVRLDALLEGVPHPEFTKTADTGADGDLSAGPRGLTSGTLRGSRQEDAVPAELEPLIAFLHDRLDKLECGFRVVSFPSGE